MEQVKSLNFLNTIPHGVTGFAPCIILTISSCKVSTTSLLDQLPPKIIPYFIRMKIGEIN